MFSNLKNPRGISKIQKNGEKEIPNGEKEIPNGEKEIPNGEKKIRKGEKEILNGEKKIHSFSRFCSVKVRRKSTDFGCWEWSEIKICSKVRRKSTGSAGFDPKGEKKIHSFSWL